MTPEQFIQKWKSATLTERAAAQSHFIDLCRLLDEPTPTDADPLGEFYCFERGATKTTGGEGWADVWKRGHFGWEYKGKRKDLNAAFGQLQQYALALENPPLLVVCDLDRFRVHTNWTNTISRVHELALDDLRDPDKRAILKAVLSDPERLKPGQTRAELTEKAAGDFGELARRLRERGHHPEAVAHFVNRLVFCMFAEDVNLLPNQMFRRMLDAARVTPSDFESLAADLFRAMRQGGRVGFETVEWFNGGLFDTDDALPLDHDDIALTLRVADLDWSEVDPSIFGTLFERGLDPDKRSQLGAHYTDREKIMLIIEPVVVRPWLADWTDAKAKIEEALSKAARTTGGTRTRFRTQAESIYRVFLDRLRVYRVLDPACGSGNFLYLALLALKDMELRVNIEAEALGLPREFPQIGPESVKGIEINPYAAELARVTVWIGEIQWMRRNGFNAGRNPILKPLDTIECRDALLNRDGSEARWPDAHAIIGNPPFLGSRKLQPELGPEYVAQLRAVYGAHVPDGADLVTFWFYKAAEKLTGACEYVGFVATNSIADGKSRQVLERATGAGGIFEAWADEPWTIDGASVRVALVCLSKGQSPQQVRLNGQSVDIIFPDLTARAGGVGVDLTKAVKLAENKGIAFQGVVPRGRLNRAEAERLRLPPATFLVDAEKAHRLLRAVGNPNGRSNADVVIPYVVGDELVNRPYGRYIVDFNGLTEFDASLFEAPFAFIAPVRSHRAHMKQKEALESWWKHWNSRPAMRKALTGMQRFIATPRVSKHRIFRWLSTAVLADNMVVAIARDDDLTFGILQSRYHDLWSLRMCSYLGIGNDPRYTPSTTFETFPFPSGMTPSIAAAVSMIDRPAQAIAEAARDLNKAREQWLNPSELTGVQLNAADGMPFALPPVTDEAAIELKQRTLTRLYNERPAWLETLHARLNAAVAAAYGWPSDIGDDDAIAALLSLNQERGAKA